MLGIIVEKTRAIRNPIECAFFLWVNIAYLQPFQDGNKRTSRLCSNLPLLLSNCAPLSFLNVEPMDYAMAMIGVYERQDVSLAVNLFEWTYRRSIEKYRALLESLGTPDPLRAKYREELVADVANRTRPTRAVQLHALSIDHWQDGRMGCEGQAVLSPFQVLGAWVENAGGQPFRSGVRIRHFQRESGDEVVELDGLFFQHARLIQVVGRGVIAVGAPLVLDVELRRVLGEAELERQGGDAFAHKTVLVGANEHIAVGQGVLRHREALDGGYRSGIRAEGAFIFAGREHALQRP
jgi:hypothetical protein